MTDPTFVRVTDGLYELATAATAAVPGYWAGYREKSALPDPATMTDVWQDVGGAYVFCGARPASYPTFLAGLDSLLAQQPRTRFVWILDPDADPAYWQAWNVTAAATGSGSEVAWTVWQDVYVAFGGYAVTMPRGAGLTLEAASVDVAALAFGAPDGTTYDAAPGSAAIPFSGPTVGCLAGTLTLANDAPDDMTRLGVGLRYSMPDPNDPNHSAVLAVPMPVLAQEGAALTAHLAFDPLHPLVPGRSALGFFAPGSADPPVLRSRLATTLGAATTLTPIRGTPPQWPARLVFATSPRVVDDPSDPDVYLTPDGAFRLAVDAESTMPRLALGVSGLEYVDVGTGVVALFQAGHPAYAPAHGDAALLPLGTTAYVALLPDTSDSSNAGQSLTYYAQPWQSPLYAPADATAFLRFHEMPAGIFASFAEGAPPVLPLGAYLAVDPALAPYAATIEQAAIAPLRRAGVPLRAQVAAADGATAPVAVTPNGLLARLSADGTAWAQVVLASLPDAAVGELALTAVGPRLQALLQSNEVFAAVSNVDEFFLQTSVRYRVDDLVKTLLLGKGVSAGVVDAIATAAGPGPYDTEEAFRAAVATAAGEWLDLLLSLSGLLKAVLQDWTFQLSPRSWRTDPATQTVLLLKYASRSLADLAADLPSWGWQEAAWDKDRNPRPTQQLVLGVLEDARTRASDDPAGPYARFLCEVADNPAWNGVLVLNAPVAVAELPRELQFVTAGIDLDEFYAHHVGFSVTPFERDANSVRLGQTAAFGLIAYDDPTDLYVEPGRMDFAYKTQQLSARFANAALADFSARVELMTNRLFGSLLTKRSPESGNNLVLVGSYQKQNAKPTYAFTLIGRNDFVTARSVLLDVEVLGIQVQTATGSVGAGTLSVDFVLTGNLRFAELPHADLFSYGPNAALPPPGTQPFDGYLRFGNLVVTMTFPIGDPGAQAFATAYDRMSFDLANSEARTQSLAKGFPVRVTGMVANPVPDPPGGTRGQTPEDLGYTGVLSQVDAVLLSPPWFGLVLTLDLGTIGALAGSAGMHATLLAGWSPGAHDDDRPVYFGLRLASADATTATWPLQGVLKLGFRGFELTTYESGGKREYLLRLRHLALSVLAFSLPPGDLDVLVFGDPSGASSAVGWYAAYDQGVPPKVPQRRLVAGRRALPEGSGWLA